MALGKNIRRLRELAGIGRPALARAIGIDSQQPIYAIEKRDSSTSDLAPSLAKHFGIDLDVLLTEDLSGIDVLMWRTLQTLYKPSDPARAPLDPKASEVAEKYQTSSEPLKRAVDDLLDLSSDDAAKVAALIAAFKNGKSKT